MSAKWRIMHPVSPELATWLASLGPRQREILQLRTGIFQGYISSAIAGSAVPSAVGWGLSYYQGKEHLLSVWPALA
jgi:hypothetical protein